MILVLNTAPTIEPVTTDEVIAHLRIDSDDETDDIVDLISEGREVVEKQTRRALLTQTWTMYLDEFPDDNFIKIPKGNLQTVSGFAYTDVNGTETEMVDGTDFNIETNGDDYGKLVLPDNVSWPSVSLAGSKAIAICFVAGWTDADSVPKAIKRAVKFAIEDSYYHGDRHEILQKVIDNLLTKYRLWGFL